MDFFTHLEKVLNQLGCPVRLQMTGDSTKSQISGKQTYNCSEFKIPGILVIEDISFPLPPPHSNTKVLLDEEENYPVNAIIISESMVDDYNKHNFTLDDEEIEVLIVAEIPLFGYFVA